MVEKEIREMEEEGDQATTAAGTNQATIQEEEEEEGVVLEDFLAVVSQAVEAVGVLEGLAAFLEEKEIKEMVGVEEDPVTTAEGTNRATMGEEAAAEVKAEGSSQVYLAVARNQAAEEVLEGSEAFLEEGKGTRVEAGVEDVLLTTAEEAIALALP